MMKRTYVILLFVTFLLISEKHWIGSDWIPNAHVGLLGIWILAAIEATSRSGQHFTTR
jgi:hypothetical protein